MKRIFVFLFLISAVALKAQVEIISSGSGVNYTVTVPGAFSLRNGIKVTFKANTNNSAAPTLNVNGTGNLQITKEGGSTPLAASDIKTGQVIEVVYDGSTWQMLSPVATAPGNGNISGSGQTDKVAFWTGASTIGFTNTFHWDNTNSRLGIGTTTPGTNLDLRGPNVVTASAIPANLSILTTETQTQDIGGSISLGGNIAAAGTPRTFASVEGRKSNSTSSDTQGYLIFKTNSGGNVLSEKMRITSNGRVGIGVTNPSFTLQVENSTVRRTGYFYNTLSAANIVNDEIMGVYGGAMGTGASDKIGGYFEASSGTGTNYGVYGFAIGGATNWAGFFQGNTHVSGNLGVGTTTPSQRLHVNGNIIIPAANEYMYATAKTSYASVSAAAFNENTGLTTVSMGGFASGNARWLVGGTPTTTAQIHAPIQLPNGATVTGITFYVHDADASYEVSGQLQRQNLGTTTVTNISTTTSSGVAFSAGIITLTGAASHIVDNDLYSYFLTFNTYQSNSNLRIYGAKVTYTVTKAD